MLTGWSNDDTAAYRCFVTVVTPMTLLVDAGLDDGWPGGYDRRIVTDCHDEDNLIAFGHEVAERPGEFVRCHS